MNPYLAKLREKYEGLRSGIEGLQTRAAEENRDLSEAELRTVSEQSDEAKKLFEQIESLTEIENRNRKVAELAADVAPAQTRSTSTTTAVDRDPGHYRSATDGGGQSFFTDLVRAREGDDSAAARLAEHNRALSTGANGTGIVPPKWLTDEYAAIARQSRRVADAVRTIPLGTDPRALTLPKQTGATSVSEQVNEGDIAAWPDEYSTSVDTVTPKMTTGKAKVTRQMLDASSPAIDQLIYTDLVGAYSSVVETRVVAAMVAAAGAPVVNAFATNSAFSATAGPDAIIDAAVAVRNARKLPADVLITNVNRYGHMLKWKDTTNRPLIPGDSGGPMNVIGTGTVQVDGRIEGLGVIATDGVSASFPESILVARASDTLLFEGTQQRFLYEEPEGPEIVRLGLWAYTAVLVRYAGASVKRLQVTAA